jgi:protein involved in sex pheromone biosynthesis
MKQTLSVMLAASFLMIAGCASLQHVDCDQVVQQRRAGQTDPEIAQNTGFSVNDVQECTESGNLAANSADSNDQNYSEPPRIPMIPSINSGSVGGHI